MFIIKNLENKINYIRKIRNKFVREPQHAKKTSETLFFRLSAPKL